MATPAMTILSLLTVGLFATRQHNTQAKKTKPKLKKNIVMIGADTLRADRISGSGYHRDLTPFIANLSKTSVKFNNCYVPCARTAPSVASLFTGSWPHRHGVRDNFVSDEETHLPIPTLAQILGEHGWTTSVVADWAGSDLGKFNLGFQRKDVPDDQWNMRFLLRQGPKDIRLFLSLFGHNRWCKRFLPELYYLAGVPLNKQVVNTSLREINFLATQDEPFFLNIFMATTHPPFGTEHPYYNMYSDPTYAGDSKFVMGGLEDPFEIVRRQGSPREEFDLDQIIDLYDGCVTNFDDEVSRIVKHLDDCGLTDNTIIVIYSDHGFEFFEHNTWGQGNSAFGEASAKVPLIIKYPNKNHAVETSDIVRSIDIAPTLLDLVNVKIPKEWDGVSLASYINEETTKPDLCAYNETGIWLTRMPNAHEKHLTYPDLFDLLEIPNKTTGTMAIKPQYKDIIIRAKDRMIRKGKWKLVYEPLTTAANFYLFNIENDVECRHNLALEHPEIVTKMTSELETMTDLKFDKKINF